jgi:hypothetical protein
MQAGPGPTRIGDFEAKIVRYDDAPTECTIFPTDVSERERTTTWLTAREGSYCSLDAMR